MSKVKIHTGSSRHHYLPQFYIKNFTNEDGLLYVYDKENKRLHKQPRPPKSIFFENDRNTVEINGIQSDVMEQIYSGVDTMLSEGLKQVLESNKIEPEHIVNVLTFASTLKWRIPLYDEEFNVLKSVIPFEKLPIEITIKDGGKSTKEAIEHLKNSNTFKESMRLIFPMWLLQNESLLKEVYEHHFINVNDKFGSIIGDVPIIQKPNLNISTMENFVFPLSKSSTFIFKNGTTKSVNHPVFYINRDIAIFHLSQKYVASASKEHLQKTAEIYYQVEQDGRVDEIINGIFDWV